VNQTTFLRPLFYLEQIFLHSSILMCRNGSH
jgi:hypothetical protein